MAADPKHEGRRLSIVHCNCLERAFHVKELVMKQCRFGEILISDTGGISTVYANDGGIVGSARSYLGATADQTARSEASGEGDETEEDAGGSRTGASGNARGSAAGGR